MNDTPPSDSENLALGRIASLVVLVGAGLYFTGWTYRWIYFSFFQLEVTTLSLPAESFYIAAFQVFFGSPRAVLLTILAIPTVAVGVYLSLWLVEDRLFNLLQRSVRKLRHTSHKLLLPCLKKRRRFDSLYRPLLKQLKSLVEFRLLEYRSLRFLRSLLDELIVLCWVLTALFWLAQWQGDADARRDAANDTSGLPIITVVVRDNGFPLGLNPEQPTNPTGIRIIGDKDRFDALLGRAINDPERDLVWRLLIDTEGDYYIFPALPRNAPPNVSPAVVVVPRNQGGDRLILLRPPQETD